MTHANNSQNNFLREYELKMAMKVSEAMENALDKFINWIMSENNLSRKCAEYYALKLFKVEFELSHDATEIVLHPKLKSIGEIMETNLDEDIECEREILNNIVISKEIFKE